MKKCSYCGRENLEDALTCAGCGKTLPASSSEPPSADLIDPALAPVVLATFGNLQEASVLAGRLQAAGIEAWIPEEYGSQVFSRVLGIEPLTVRVAAKDYEAARQILAEPADAELPPETAASGNGPSA